MRIKYVCLWYFLLAICPVRVLLAQNLLPRTVGNPSWSKKVVTKIRKDTSEIHQILRLGETLGVQYPDSSKKLYYEALQKSRAIRYSDGGARALFGLGMQSLEKGLYKESLILFQQALPYCRMAIFDNSLLANCCNKIGTTYLRQGNYKDANRFYHIALDDLQQKNIESRITVQVLNNLCIIQNELGQHTNALVYINRGEAIARRKQFTNMLAYCLVTKGTIFQREGKYGIAKSCFTEALTFAKQTQDLYLEYGTLTILGQTFLKEKMPANAIPYLEDVISKANEANLPNVSINASYSLGEAYNDLRDFHKAVAVLLPAIHEAETLDMQNDLCAANQTLASAYASLGENKLAYQHLQKAWVLNDSLMGKEKTDAINNLEVKYRTAEKDKALAIGNLQLEKKEKDLAKKNLWIGGISGGAILLILAFASLYRANQHKQTLQAEKIRVLQQEQKIGMLQAMMNGEEKERSRIGKELHDGIGGLLSAMKMNLSLVENASTEEGNAPLERVHKLLDDTTIEVSKTAHNLMPEMLFRHGLADAIAIFCENICRGHELHIDFQAYGDLQGLDKEMQLSLYRIVQELVHNMVKHARATEGIVQIARRISEGGFRISDLGEGADKMEIVSISVEDNGVGFDTVVPKTGLGLSNLGERIQTMNGQMQLVSGVGEGTRVYVEFRG